MATASTTPAVSDGLSGILGQIGAESGKLDTEMQQHQQRAGVLQSNLQAVAADKPAQPALSALPAKPPQRSVDIMQGAANPMAILAIFGSLLTRRPMINALNAASASAMGFAQGNKEAYDRAENDWRDNMQLAIQQNQMELERYRAAMEAHQGDVNAALAAIQAEATGFHDQVLISNAKVGNYQAIAQIMESRTRMGIEAQNHLDMLQFHRDQFAQVQAHQKEQERLGQERIDVSKEKTQKATQDRNRAITATEDQVDKAIAMIDKDPTVVGGLGFLRGAGEKALGIAADVGLAGQQADTPANNFAQTINSIQLTAQNTLRGTASRWKDAKLQEIISGLTMTTNSQIARNQLVQFKALLQSMSADEMPMPDVPLPAVGDVQDGYIYNGGDPGDPSSWTQQAPQ